MANRNKTAGSNHERKEVTAHSRYFKDVKTTRLCNRARDNEGIDLCNEHELELGRFPVDTSCKTAATTTIPYPHLLTEMGGGPHKVVHHRRTVKSEGGKFMVKGEYSLMTRDTYEMFLQHVYTVQLLRIKNPELIAELEKQYELELLNVPQQIVL